MTTSIQKQLTSSPTTRTITLCRDSIFVKIQRGKIDAEKVIVLKKSLSECGATKTLYVKVIQLKDMRADSLEVIILKHRKKFSSKKKSSLKDKKSKKFFLKGTVAGVILTIIVDQVLHVVKRS
jgi:hypothetical protein